MTYEEIEKFMNNKNGKGLPVTINFKTRKSLRGLFIKMSDYEELRRKNLWRIVSGPNIDPYQATKDPSLARIFNGAEMTRLEMTS
ncbi:MAG TPA: hypothetical protein VLJ68_05745 [Chitinophagaceae bacterium]|nr:hypothetical protein [Chitinophagaceae bacterium]